MQGSKDVRRQNTAAAVIERKITKKKILNFIAKDLEMSQGLLRLSKDLIYFPDSCFSAISTNFLVI